MWQVIRELRASGVTIILTTHYIDEAEEIADRVGVINRGEIVLVEEKAELMRKLGRKQLTLDLQEPLPALPAALQPYRLELAADGGQLIYTYDAKLADTRIPALLADLDRAGIRFKDLKTTQSSLEDIFVTLRQGAGMNLPAIKAIYLFEMARTARTLLQSIVSPVLSTALYFVVFGAAIGVADQRDRRRRLRLLHRAGAGDAVAADAEHLQRLVRDLLPQVHRHDLRAAVGAGLAVGGRDRLCRRRGHQVRSSSG